MYYVMNQSHTSNTCISTQSFELYYPWGGGVIGVYVFFLEYSPALFNLLHFLFLEVVQLDDVMTAVGRCENTFVIGDSSIGVSTRPFYVVNSTIF
jgi:hypothetical protein